MTRWLADPVVERGLIIGAGGGLVLMLYALDPASSRLYPVCVFHQLTGWFCPGCGSARALHALAHGHLAAALRFNPLTVFSTPFVAVALVRRTMESRSRPSPHVHPAWIWVFAIVVMAFFVLRNIPLYPWTLLAPRG